MVKMNGDQSIDSNNDESFVVLERYTEEKDSSRSTVQGESFVTPPGNQNIVYPGVNQPNSSQSVVSNSTTPAVSIPMLSMESVLSMNSEEIQKRLQDLIKENADLKVTLQQHNLAMKQQFQTLKMWQDEVYKVHQVHKEKFEETKQYINKITLENKELKKALEEKPKGEVQNNEANSKLLAENAALQKQNSVLQEKLCAVIQREKKYIMQPSAKEAELNSVVESLTRQLEVAERARRQLSIDVERLNALHSRTHPPVGAPIATLEESQSHENVQPAEQVKRYNEWLQRLEKNEDDINRGSLTSWIPVDSGDVTFEIRELRKLIAQEQKLSASRKESIGEVRQCFERLLSDYQKLYLDWDWLKQEQSIKERDDAYEEVQRNGYREKVDSLTAQLVDLKDAISEKNSHIDLLTAQVNIYQSDFEAERKSREDLVGVKEKLAEDLRHLQRRNQQLLDELMRFQDGSTRNNHPQSGRSVSHSPSPAPASQPAPYVVNQPPEEIPIQTAEYTCPNPECNKVFDSFKPLERHVTQCLKLED